MAKSKPGPAKRLYKCHMCHGTGSVPAQPRNRRGSQRTCPNCHGRGEV